MEFQIQPFRNKLSQSSDQLFEFTLKKIQHRKFIDEFEVFRIACHYEFEKLAIIPFTVTSLDRGGSHSVFQYPKSIKLSQSLCRDAVWHPGWALKKSHDKYWVAYLFPIKTDIISPHRVLFVRYTRRKPDFISLTNDTETLVSFFGTTSEKKKGSLWYL